MIFSDSPRVSKLSNAPSDKPNIMKSAFCAKVTPQPNENKNAVRRASFAGVRRSHAIICRRQRALSSIPGRSSRTPPRLPAFPETSSRSNPKPFQCTPIHRSLCGDVRPRLQQQLHHLKMTMFRNDVQRRISTLRCAHSRQQPAPAPHPGPDRVRPFGFTSPWS